MSRYILKGSCDNKGLIDLIYDVHPDQRVYEYHIIYGEPYVECNLLYPDNMVFPLQKPWSQSFMMYELDCMTRPKMKQVYNEDGRGYEDKIMWAGTKHIWVQWRKVYVDIVDIDDIVSLTRCLPNRQMISIEFPHIQTVKGPLPTQYDYPVLTINPCKNCY